MMQRDDMPVVKTSSVEETSPGGQIEPQSTDSEISTVTWVPHSSLLPGDVEYLRLATHTLHASYDGV